MANEISGITTACNTIRVNFNTIAAGVAGTRPGKILDELAAAILKELTPLFQRLGPTAYYEVQTLGGPATAAAVKTEYLELSGF